MVRLKQLPFWVCSDGGVFSTAGFRVARTHSGQSARLHKLSLATNKLAPPPFPLFVEPVGGGSMKQTGGLYSFLGGYPHLSLHFPA